MRRSDARRFHTSFQTSRRGLEGCNPCKQGVFHTFQTFHTSAPTCAYAGMHPHARTRARTLPLFRYGRYGRYGKDRQGKAFRLPYLLPHLAEVWNLSEDAR